MLGEYTMSSATQQCVLEWSIQKMRVVWVLLSREEKKNDFSGVLFVPSLVVVILVRRSKGWKPLD
jgi:hypothetical protein